MPTHSDRHYGPGARDCKGCGGSGYFRWDVDTDHPQFGQMFDCPDCRPNAVKKKTGITDPAVWERPEGWYYKLPVRKELEDASHMFTEQCLSGDVGGWLSMIGAFGCGKTTLSEKIIVDLTRAGLSCLYVDAAQFGIAMQELFEFRSNDKPLLIRRMLAAQILVWDQGVDYSYNEKADGSISFTGHWVGLVGFGRYADRSQKATVVITNLEWWDDMEKNKGDAATRHIYDRMKEFDVAICRARGLRHILGKTATARRVAVIAAMEGGSTYEQAVVEAEGGNNV